MLIHICVYVSMCIYVCVHVSVCMCLCLCVCMYVHVSVYVSMCMYLCVYESMSMCQLFDGVHWQYGQFCPAHFFAAAQENKDLRTPCRGPS